MATGNIFWDIQNELWTLLEAKAAFTDEVKEPNRIKFTGDKRAPRKAVWSHADTPEVMVWQAGILARDRRASNSTSMMVQWEVLVHSGQQTFDPFFDVQWSVFVALLDWDTTMKAITWSSENPVKNCDTLSAKDSLLDDSKQRNMRGWRSAWVGKTDCWFNHTNLQAVS